MLVAPLEPRDNRGDDPPQPLPKTRTRDQVDAAKQRHADAERRDTDRALGLLRADWRNARVVRREPVSHDPAEGEELPTYTIAIGEQTIDVRDLRALKRKGVYKSTAADFLTSGNSHWLLDKNGGVNPTSEKIRSVIDAYNARQ